MNRFALVGAALLSIAAFAGAASAADLAARPYTKAPAMIPALYDWTGFYVGVNGGGGSARECYTITSVAGVPVFPNSVGGHDATGGLVGGQLGYRLQAASLVLCLEVQGDLAYFEGLNSSLTGIGPY